MKHWYKSLRYAWRGCRVVFATERNFRFHVFIALIVLLAAAIKQVDRYLWLILFLTIGLVLSLEIMNSAVERLVDLLAPKTHPFAKEIKDLLAAMVLVVSIFALLIGIVIFVIK